MDFILLLGLTFAASAAFPSLGSALGRGGHLTTVLIMLMYLGMGMGMSLKRLASGVMEWRLHLATQAAIFVISPLLSVAAFSLTAAASGRENAMGLLFVGCLPTTLTSCALLTRKLGGNDVAAIYNSILSQLLGVVLSPVLLSILLSSQVSYVADLREVFLDLGKKIVLPMTGGQILAIAAPGFVRKLGAAPSKIAFYSIFAILFMNISDAIEKGNFYQNLRELWVPVLATGLLSAAIVLVLWLAARRLRFPVSDAVSVCLTGSHKTLGMGIPLAISYFPTHQSIVNKVSLLIIAYYVWSLTTSFIIVRALRGRIWPAIGDAETNTPSPR